MNPNISVIMSVYDESKSQLQRSIDSILKQSFSEFEFIIILDKPDNLEAKKYIIEKKSTDNRIVFVENQTNIQSGPSINKGVSISQGKYIALMDADDTCDISRLYKQFEYLEANKGIDILFTGWQEIDEKGKITIRIPSKSDFDNIEKTFFYKSPILHASMMCKAKILKANKYSTISRPADFELFLTLISKGFVFDFIPENLYSYYIDSYNQKQKYQKMKIFSSNFLKILFKNISLFKKNIFFWWMFLILIIQWLLTRNKIIFYIFFNLLQRIYRVLIIR